MATLNMFDVLSSPEFLDQASYIRTTSAVSWTGVAVDTPSTPIPFQAVVTPDGTTMQRLPDGSRLSGSIVIYTQTWLTNGLKSDDANSTRADIVVWHGRQYVVADVQDFDAFAGLGGGVGVNFGPDTPRSLAPGFWVVSADLLPLNPAIGT